MKRLKRPSSGKTMNKRPGCEIKSKPSTTRQAMKENTELPTALLEHTPWENEVNPIWPASSFLLHRNLSQSFFPPKMNEKEALQVLELLKEAFNKATELTEPTFLKAELLSALDKEFLFEHFLC